MSFHEPFTSTWNLHFPPPLLSWFFQSYICGINVIFKTTYSQRLCRFGSLRSLSFFFPSWFWIHPKVLSQRKYTLWRSLNCNLPLSYWVPVDMMLSCRKRKHSIILGSKIFLLWECASRYEFHFVVLFFCWGFLPTFKDSDRSEGTEKLKIWKVDLMLVR